ncbi:MAG: response regulator [Actinomycetota bacterium]
MGIRNTKILIVEDEALVRSLITSLLEGDGMIIRSAANAAEARKITSEFTPDVAVLDIELGDGPAGIDLAHILRMQFPEIGLVFLTHIPEPRVIGVENSNIPKNAAYLRKDLMGNADQLRKAIYAAQKNRIPKDLREDKTSSHKLAGVSRSQLEVLRLVAMGMSNQEIASRRGTTVRAVENLIKRSFQAAGVNGETAGNLRVVAAREFIQVAGMPHAR